MVSPKFGVATGRTILWFHGTPARRSSSRGCRVMAATNDLRIIGIATGNRTFHPHLYSCIYDSVPDVVVLLDQFECGAVCCGRAIGRGSICPCHRARHAGSGHGGRNIGRGRPKCGRGPYQWRPCGSLDELAICAPLGSYSPGKACPGLDRRRRTSRSSILDLYARLSPEGDRIVLAREEVKAMLLDDLITNSRHGMGAPLNDLILFSSALGFRCKRYSRSSSLVAWRRRQHRALRARTSCRIAYSECRTLCTAWREPSRWVWCVRGSAPHSSGTMELIVDPTSKASLGRRDERGFRAPSARIGRVFWTAIRPRMSMFRGAPVRRVCNIGSPFQGN